ncbi:hypothetical protein AAF712_006578 [Marasmius tenuissimus]|uniref:Uncharacterized protein n=1 Tax=Marasmius tenuissimus TaxID=585030 RepID=A0ABR2ZYH5_9AGAR
MTDDFAQFLEYPIFQSVEDTGRFHEDNEDQHVECPNPPDDLDCDQTNDDNDSDYPEIQKECDVEKSGDALVDLVGEPTSTQVVGNGRTNPEEEGMYYRNYTNQNLLLATDNTCSEHTVVEPCLERLPPLLRRDTSNHSPAHMEHLLNTNSSPSRQNASANPYESRHNPFLPSFPNTPPIMDSSFNMFHGIMNTASMTVQTESAAGRSLEMPQHTMLAVPSHGVTSQWPQRNTYAGGAVTNGFPYSTPTPTSSFSAPLNVYAARNSMPIPGEHTAHMFGRPGMSRVERGAEHHRMLPITSPGAFPMSPYAPAVGYPTNSPPMGGFPRTAQTAAHDYRPMPPDCPNSDSASMSYNYNMSYEPDTGVVDMARDISTRSRDERGTRLDTPSSVIPNNRLAHTGEARHIPAMEATSYDIFRPILSSSQPDVDELCVRFERLAIV